MILIVWAKDRLTGRAATFSAPVPRMTMKQAIKTARQFMSLTKYKLTFVQIAGHDEQGWYEFHLPTK